MSFKVCASPDATLALTNCAFVNPADAAGLQVPNASTPGNYVLIKDFVYTFQQSPKINPGYIGLNNIQRQCCNVSLNELTPVIPFVPKGEDVYLSSLYLHVDFLAKGKKIDGRFEVEDIRKQISASFTTQIFTIGQKFVIDFRGVNLELKVIDTVVVNLGEIANPGSSSEKKEQVHARGILMQNTEIVIEKTPGSTIPLSGGGGPGGGIALFKTGWKFESMGIGGLDKEFGDIFRRAFASRLFPPTVVSKLGIQHVKGILLFGPPGTGKTLIARQIGKMLNGKEPKIVNGPEILNKYVGQSEENIRNLFRDAEMDQKANGDNSELHIIIFDELDAICRQRGSRTDSTGVGDTVVNQLLSKIDGVEALNNILIIGMTNRKDMIDEALLRPGRLEVHMEIGLPDQQGRLEILRIHTTKMRDNKFMDTDVDLAELAEITKNYSGAEIEGVVKAATSYAFTRQVDINNLKSTSLDPSSIKVNRADFLRACLEVRPAFGFTEDEFEGCIRNGIINYSPSFDKIMQQGRLFIRQVANSNRTPLISVLLEGKVGSGKTAIAATLAKESEFPFIKLISPEALVGYSEAAKCSKITKVFDDSYKSPLSVIVVDDIERLLEFVPIGPRFSNAILQTLLVLIKKVPPKGRKLLVIATTSNKRVIRDMDFMDSFSAALEVPTISTPDEFRAVLNELHTFPNPADLEKAVSSFIKGRQIPVKKLIVLSEMAKQGEASEVLDRFITFVSDFVTDQDLS
eukprot:TRINITY_DN2365_c0_g1_i2.p1 TRINITY_DN2365_c0_g1~~TRINITY_DN2365_c0_g1_i2.p1  ORF type:complete len:744 (+),score=154.16 TRINITY_DN2365_c0_g1_i2:279-2510(+)